MNVFWFSGYFTQQFKFTGVIELDKPSNALRYTNGDDTGHTPVTHRKRISGNVQTSRTPIRHDLPGTPDRRGLHQVINQ